jgi:ankyrin repeat protein
MGPKTLKSAAEKGDLDAVQFYLANGADINATTAAGHFALGGAILNRHSHIVEYLIANGASIDQTSEFGWSPLYLAAWTGSAEIAAHLLLAGANPNTKTRGGRNSPSGYTPLHIAAESGRLAIVMLLVARGARVNERNGSSETALELAIESGHNSIATFLKDSVRFGVRQQKSRPSRSSHSRAADGVLRQSLPPPLVDEAEERRQAAHAQEESYAPAERSPLR